MTKQDIAEYLVARGLLCKTFDYALPQGWLDQFKGEEYDKVRSSTVWAYPEGKAFGEPIDINKLYQEATMKRPELTVEVVKVPEEMYPKLLEQVPWLFGVEGEPDETPHMFTADEVVSASDSCEDDPEAQAWLESVLEDTTKWALVCFERPDVNFSNYYQLTAKE